MSQQTSYEKLLYRYELMHSQLEVRKYFLNTVVREIYDNICQVLSYVRIQFALAESRENEQWRSMGGEAYTQLGKVIGDLRELCRLFDPMEQLVSNTGFLKAFEWGVRSLFPQAVLVIEETICMQELNTEKKLFALGWVLDLILLIKSQGRSLLSFSIKLLDDEIQFVLGYYGDAIALHEKTGEKETPGLSLVERARLVNGVWEYKREENEINKIILRIPYN